MVPRRGPNGRRHCADAHAGNSADDAAARLTTTTWLRRSLHFLAERIRFAMERGVAKSRIVLDPGIGFGKAPDHNLDLLAHLHMFTDLGFPLLVGPSSKGSSAS